MLREIKQIVEKELGFEIGDIKVERIFDNGVFKGLKIEIDPSNGRGVYTTHDKHTITKNVDDKQYDDFMEEYYKQHECCPKCGSDDHISTLVGYVLNMDRKEEYKDLNKCECLKCGDKHSAHDRVPSIER